MCVFTCAKGWWGGAGRILTLADIYEFAWPRRPCMDGEPRETAEQYSLRRRQEPRNFSQPLLTDPPPMRLSGRGDKAPCVAVPLLGRLEESDDVAVRITHGGNESARADGFYVLDGLRTRIQE